MRQSIRRGRINHHEREGTLSEAVKDRIRRIFADDVTLWGKVEASLAVKPQSRGPLETEWQRNWSKSNTI